MRLAILGRAVAPRFARTLREPLQRNGYLLVANTGLMAVSGLAFWWLAARLYPAFDVGTDSAAISAMTLLAGFGQLNLMSAVVRFVPGAGRHAKRMLGWAFGTVTVLSGLAAIVFLAGLRLWTPGLVGLFASPAMKATFIAGTVGWAALSLLGPTMVALGGTPAVPVTNGSFSLVKAGFVAAGAVLVPFAGIWLSWSAATALACVAGGGYVVWRLLPRFEARSRGPGAVPTRRELVRYIGPDCVGFLAWSSALALTPILVLDLTGAKLTAAFTLDWSIAVVLYTVASSFGQSQLASGAVDPASAERHYRQSLRHLLALLAGPVVLLAVAAPELLSLFGPWYAAQGTTAIRLLAVSALPNAVLAVEVARARVLTRLAAMAAGLLGLLGLTLGLTVALVPPLGISGAALAWLAGLCIVATGLVAWHLATERNWRLPWAARGGAGRVPPGVLHRVLEGPPGDGPGGLTVLARPRTVSGVTVLFVSRGPTTAVVKAASGRSPARALAQEQAVLTRLAAEERFDGWRCLVPAVLAGGTDGRWRWLVIDRIAGSPVRPRGDRWRALTVAALQALDPLHRLDTRTRPADAEVVARLVDGPVRRVAGVLRTSRQRRGLARLAAELHRDLAAASPTIGWCHGDFCPGNVLFDAAGNVSGIIDWSQARPDGLAVVDVALWCLTARTDGRTPRIGAAVARRLTTGCWTADESELLKRYGRPGNLPGRTVLLLAWLQHVDGNLTKADRYERSLLWKRTTILPVLRAVGR